MPQLTGGDQVAYDVFVALHVASAVVGFGSVALSGVYGGNARRLEEETAAEELRRYFRAPGRLELAVLAVPVFGAAAVAVGSGRRGFGEAWVEAALGLWVVAAVLLLIARRAGAVLRRASLAAEAAGISDTAGVSDPGAVTGSACAGPPPAHDGLSGRGVLADPRLPAAGRRLQWAAAASDLVFLVALVIMVVKPGS